MPDATVEKIEGLTRYADATYCILRLYVAGMQHLGLSLNQVALSKDQNDQVSGPAAQDFCLMTDFERI